MISDDLKCIYIHIPKVAGTSIKYALSKHTRHPSVLCEYVNRAMRQIRNKNSFQHYNNGLSEHAKALDYKNNIKSYEEYFSFTFVRNPYDWAVSNYEYMRQKKTHPSHKKIMSLNFDEYVSYLCNSTFRQSDHVLDGHDNIIVDFIGKYETIDNDISLVANKLGVDFRLARLNASKRDDWKYYYNARTARKIRNHFSRDFTLFSYSDEF